MKPKLRWVLVSILVAMTVYFVLPTPVCQLWMCVDEEPNVFCSGRGLGLLIGDCDHEGIKVVYHRGSTNGTGYFMYHDDSTLIEFFFPYWRKIRHRMALDFSSHYDQLMKAPGCPLIAAGSGESKSQ